MGTERVMQYECKVCGRKIDVSKTGDVYEEPVYCCGIEAAEISVQEAPSIASVVVKKPAKKKAKKKAAKKAKKKAKKKVAKKAVKKKAAKKKAVKKKAKKKAKKRK